MKSIWRSLLIGIAAVLHPNLPAKAAEVKPMVQPSEAGPLDQSEFPSLPDSFHDRFDLGMRDETVLAPLIVDPEVKHLHGIAFAAWCVQEEERWAKVMAVKRRPQ